MLLKYANISILGLTQTYKQSQRETRPYILYIFHILHTFYIQLCCKLLTSVDESKGSYFLFCF